MISLPHFPLFLVAVVSALLFSSCTTTPTGSVHISKVNPYHFVTGKEFVRTEDEMLQFEHWRYYHGAVEAKELREREGNYYSVFWKTKTRNPATVRFDYRLGSTGPQIHTKEVFVSSPKKSNVTKFEVTGAEYAEKGKVTQWKVSIVESGVVVAEFKSFLWK